MPIISLGGKLLSPLFILMKEPGGKFPQKGIKMVIFKII
jgi:hypothetical protein